MHETVKCHQLRIQYARQVFCAVLVSGYYWCRWYSSFGYGRTTMEYCHCTNMQSFTITRVHVDRASKCVVDQKIIILGLVYYVYAGVGSETSQSQVVWWEHKNALRCYKEVASHQMLDLLFLNLHTRVCFCGRKHFHAWMSVMQGPLILGGLQYSIHARRSFHYRRSFMTNSSFHARRSFYVT